VIGLYKFKSIFRADGGRQRVEGKKSHKNKGFLRKCKRKTS
jgi:hypothetical protein